MKIYQEEELNRQFIRFVDVFMGKQPLGLLKSILRDDSFVAYGTAVDEKVLSSKEMLAIAKRQRKELKGKKYSYRVLPVAQLSAAEGKSVTRIDELEITMGEGTEAYQFTFRMSSLFEFINGQWRVYHMHASVPDVNIQEGASIPMSELQRKNKELEEEVRNRTAELENKNRELEIEATLERIRARALTMQRSEELIDIAVIMREQMLQLNQKEVESCYVLLYDDVKRTMVEWSAFRPPEENSKEFLSGTISWDYNESAIIKRLVSIYKSGKNEATYIPRIESLKDLMNKLAEKMPEVFSADDDFGLSRCVHYLTRFSGGHLLTITVDLPSEETKRLQKRITSVFDLAYRRFLDLKKAEEQTREAQIEVALERVRARTMAMHNSEELREVIAVAFEQLMHLGFPVNGCAFIIYDKETRDAYYWFAGFDGAIYPKAYRMPYNEHPYYQAEIKAWERGERFKVFILEGELKKKYDDHLFEETEWVNLPESSKKGMRNLEYAVINEAFMSHGAIASIGIEPIHEQDALILQRFAQVFDQTYTRFLDLQKAESQAREARIEAALERVRARSMAMHHSEEIPEVALVVLEQIAALEIPHVTCAINIFEGGGWEFISYSANRIGPEGQMVMDQLPKLNLNNLGFMRKAIRNRKNWGPYNTLELKGKYLEEMLELWRASNFSGIKNQYIQNKPKTVYLHWAPIDGLHSISLSSVERLSEEQLDVLARIAKTFSSSYTRFLDLQKAESQAREAQLEAALERVRARAMAMHKTDELIEMVGVLYDEMKQFELSKWGMDVKVFNEQEEYMEWWLATVVDGELPCAIRIHGKKHPVINRLWKEWKNQTPRFILHHKDKVKLDYDRYWLEESENEIPRVVKEAVYAEKEVFLSLVSMKSGLFEAVDIQPIPEDKLKIIERFARVFDQAYTRFLDIRQAEEQTREAEIQLALERVRAQSMAMHRSGELGHVAASLFEQLHKLGLRPDRTLLPIVNSENDTADAWMTTQSGEAFYEGIRVLLTGHKVLDELYSKWKEGEEFIIQDLSGKKLKNFLDWIRKKTNTPYEDPGTRRVYGYASFRYGMLAVVQREEISNEEIEILKRFAKVFEQSYTRFLDLQKAEAQAHEAKIQLSLERIRAQTMAMHKSNELSEVVAVIYKEMDELQLADFGANIQILDEENQTWQVWLSHIINQFNPRPYVLPVSGHPYLEKQRSSFLANNPEIHIHLKGNTKKSYDDYLFNNSDFRDFPEELKNNIRSYKEVHFNGALMKYGYITAVNVTSPINEDHFEILKRFAQVFEQTYTRFLDLQKAEAQAKESEIQLALERVRARTMAMHKSSDLSETASLMFHQLIELGIRHLGCGFAILNPDTPTAEMYFSINGEILEHSFPMDMNLDAPLRKVYKDWKEKKETALVELKGDALKKHFEGLEKHFSTSNFDIGKDLFAFYARASEDKLTQLFVHHSYFSQGFLVFSNTMPIAEIDILQRFAGVFDQTYTRFLDLKKAEAQAREAEIELSLERVRAATMAMHNSDQLLDVLAIVFRELKLSQGFGMAIMLIFEPDGSRVRWYSTGLVSDVLPESYDIEIKPAMRDHPWLKRYLKALKNNVTYDLYQLRGEIKSSWDRYMFTETEMRHVPKATREAMMSFESVYLMDAFIQQGVLEVANAEPLDEDQIKVLMRFAQVINLTYTRFLDLKNAEAQIRESEIQLALERVRSRTMAMHKSAELSEVIELIYEQIDSIGMPVWGCSIIVCDEEERTMNYWYSEANQTLFKNCYILPLSDHPVVQRQWNSWKSGIDHFSIDLLGKDKDDYTKYLLNETVFKSLPEAVKEGWWIPENIYFFYSNLKYGMFEFVDIRPLNPENFPIYNRFARVFEQTYTRFLDLQKAELQAREAQIEAGLERLRSRTMAMHKSEELGEVATTLYTELQVLGISQFITCGYLDISEEGYVANGWSTVPGAAPVPFSLPLKGDAVLNERYKAWKDGVPLLTQKVEWKKLQEHLANAIPHMNSKEIEEIGRDQFADPTYFYIGNLSQGYLFITSIVPLDEDQASVFTRFSHSFEMTYKRFLDLQKAEAQAREAQIETGLERLRARTMAMHKSEELGEVAVALYAELQTLGVTQFITCGYLDISETRSIASGWTTVPGAEPLPLSLPLKGDAVLNERYKAWENGVAVLTQKVSGKTLQKHLANVIPNINSKKIEEIIRTQFADPTYFYIGNLSKGYLFITSISQLDKDQVSIFNRFSRTFEMTYKRFLDLQKAEAQAREAQIEASLERVRARTMAMHNSDDVGECVVLMFNELTRLGISADTRCGIGILNHYDEKMELWTAWTDESGSVHLNVGNLDMSLHPILQSARNAWKEQRDCNYYLLENEDIIKYYQIINASAGYKQKLKLDFRTNRIHHYDFVFDLGIIYVFSPRLLNEDQQGLLRRFTTLFEQTYRRHLDLVKAENQAEEARIEAALERVRSKAMAMHNSEDLPGTAIIAFTELNKLGFEPMRCGISLHNRDNRVNLLYAGTNSSEGDTLTLLGHALLDDHPILSAIYDKWLEGEDYFPRMKGKVLLDYYEKVRNTFAIPVAHQSVEEQFGYFMHFTHGVFYGWCDREIQEEEKKLLRRFASVVDLTFKRYFDLQAAESRAREAQIETALERVRSRTMAMHNSADFAEVVVVLFQQLQSLGIDLLFSYITLAHGDKWINTWFTEPGGNLNVKTLRQSIAADAYMADTAREAYTKSKNYFFTDRSGEELYRYLDLLDRDPDVKMVKTFKSELKKNPELCLYMTSAFFKYGFIGYAAFHERKETDLEILQRFGRVFQQTYTRFLDLQKAEAHARETIREAAVDRVRAEIASMRSTADLQRITPLLWKELTTLQVPFLRCGVFIIDEEKERVDLFLTTPGGQSLGVLHLNFDDNEVTRKVVDSWRDRKNYIISWSKKDFMEWLQSMVSLGQVSDERQYKGGDEIPESLYLQFLPFNYGMLYVGSTEALNEDQLDVVARLAQAFSVAYARYADFSKLEDAKQNLEKSFSELRAAQAQLVQSEKMASLGELTAGIAHEIQNPLNFVNNFSEVSYELVDEALEELENRDMEEAKAILTDMRQNLQKINHHGKRASDIVRSMLQHSRTSTGQKELTDINALCDEYLRLAYHGMRAKNKGFNASYETHFDPNLPRIEVIPQDIGRVLLNLINNGFQAIVDVENPQLSIKTLLAPSIEEGLPAGQAGVGGVPRGVLITVSDNGPGIPDGIKDKIFQPFFTTKPTGQGTGLGLSLSYDIVKAHGGEILVESIEGNGTEFRILLPV